MHDHPTTADRTPLPDSLRNPDADFAPSLAFFRVETADGRVARGWRIYTAKLAAVLVAVVLITAWYVLRSDVAGSVEQVVVSVASCVVGYAAGVLLARRLAVFED